MPIAGAGIGWKVNEWKEEALAERDAQKRHYIELHPELFPQPGERCWYHPTILWFVWLIHPSFHFRTNQVCPTDGSLGARALIVFRKSLARKFCGPVKHFGVMNWNKMSKEYTENQKGKADFFIRFWKKLGFSLFSQKARWPASVFDKKSYCGIN